MKSISLHHFLSAIIPFLGVVAVLARADLNAPRTLTPARGHYEKLARLDPQPSNAKLAIDEKRFANNPASVERIGKMETEFVRVGLDEFKLPTCPANSSRQTRAEIDYLLRLQAQRTEAEGERALYFAPWGYSTTLKPDNPNYAAYRANLFYVGRSIGSWFNPKDLPLTADLIARVWRDASYYVWSLKFKYSRIRPWVIDPELKNLDEANWAAFPSGHSSYSHILAYLYSELAPEFSDIFLTDARNVAHSREIIGVHYPSDSEAGRVFARQFVNLLLQNDKFKTEFAKAAEEWSRVRAQSPD
jgi:acid phosphatase (class A)